MPHRAQLAARVVRGLQRDQGHGWTDTTEHTYRQPLSRCCTNSNWALGNSNLRSLLWQLHVHEARSPSVWRGTHRLALSDAKSGNQLAKMRTKTRQLKNTLYRWVSQMERQLKSVFAQASSTHPHSRSWYINLYARYIVLTRCDLVGGPCPTGSPRASPTGFLDSGFQHVVR